MTRIRTGARMGTLMWANVWFVIWPAQQIVIANAETVAGGGEANPAAVGAGGKAGMASRTNTLFSIPMLLFMAAGSHLEVLAKNANLPDVSVVPYWIAAFVVIGLVEINGLIGPGASSQKLLTTVSGTIHAGLGLAVVLVPATSATSAFSTSPNVFVTAPEPIVSSKAATEDAWQSRVQWSTLLVPKAARTNF